ncbi:MAG TPA: rod shape-determining protein MreD [Nevskiaceae bacterium]
MNPLRLVTVYLCSLILGLFLQFMPPPGDGALFWPSWSMLILAAWALNMHGPHLLAALVLGVALDVGFSSTLGEHAVVLLLTTYVVMRAAPRLELRAWWQVALLLAPLWLGGTFLMMVFDHFTHHEAGISARWLPVVSEALLWPIVNRIVARLAKPAYPGAV